MGVIWKRLQKRNNGLRKRKMKGKREGTEVDEGERVKGEETKKGRKWDKKKEKRTEKER